MNKFKVTTIAAALIGCALPVFAAAATLPTNFVQNISAQLVVTMPGSNTASGAAAKITSLKTKDVIKAMGAVLGDTFSPGASVVYVAAISYYTNTITNMVHGKTVTNFFVNGYPGVATPGAIQIRDGTKVVDITSLFQIANVSNAVSAYVVNAQGGYKSYTSYGIRSINVTNSMLAFSGQGFVTTPLVNIKINPTTTVVGYNNIWTSFNGVTTNGVVQGTFSAIYSKLE